MTVASFGLATRRMFVQGRGIVPKILEFNLRALLDVLRERPSVVWAHNQESAPVVALCLLLRWAGWIERVVWDQHELPAERILSGSFRRRLLARLMRACDVVVGANEQRTDFLRSQLPGSEHICFGVLENWADETFRELPSDSLPGPVRDWLQDRPYVLLQGGAHPGRHLDEVVQAVIDLLDEDTGLVVVGGRQDAVIDSLRDRWGTEFEHHVWLAGWVPQMEMPIYIDHAVASLVLYEASSPNSLYCAPNRLFQAVTRGTPVIVGANPPMASLVSRLGMGVVLDGTGDSPEDIARGIHRLLATRTEHRRAIVQIADSFLWEKQDPEIARICFGSAAMQPTE